MIPSTAEELPTPILKVFPNIVEFVTGDRLMLECNHGAPDAPAYEYVTFYHDLWQMKENSLSIALTNLNPEDSGNYTCDIMYDSGPSPKSNVLSLVVGKLPITIYFPITADYIYCCP